MINLNMIIIINQHHQHLSVVIMTNIKLFGEPNYKLFTLIRASERLSLQYVEESHDSIMNFDYCYNRFQITPICACHA